MLFFPLKICNKTVTQFQEAQMFFCLMAQNETKSFHSCSFLQTFLKIFPFLNLKGTQKSTSLPPSLTVISPQCFPSEVSYTHTLTILSN